MNIILANLQIMKDDRRDRDFRRFTFKRLEVFIVFIDLLRKKGILLLLGGDLSFHINEMMPSRPILVFFSMVRCPILQAHCQYETHSRLSSAGY